MKKYGLTTYNVFSIKRSINNDAEGSGISFLVTSKRGSTIEDTSVIVEFVINAENKDAPLDINLIVDRRKIWCTSCVDFTSCGADAQKIQEYLNTIHLSLCEPDKFMTIPTRSEIRITKKKGYYFLMGEVVDKESRWEFIPPTIIEPISKKGEVISSTLLPFIISVL